MSKFTVGQSVTMTNDNGVVFTGKTVVEIEVREGKTYYYITPTDTPWYAFPERNLSANA